MSLIELNDCKLHILSVIKGLEVESDKVKKSFRTVKPDAVAVSLSREDLNALKDYSGEPEDAEPLNFEEAVYIREMKDFGGVKKPPPCYLTAVRLCKDWKNVSCVPVDMNEEDYTDAFCRNVSTIDLYRHSWSGNRFQRRKFKATAPEDFVLEFDRALTRLSGYRMLEKERERHMAKRLLKLSKKYRSILSVIELERSAGVQRLVKEKSEEG